MNTSHTARTTYLQDLWMETEGNDAPKADERLRHLIRRRIAALLTYARGVCQKKDVHEKLDVVESIAAARIGEIGNPNDPSQLIDEWTMDSAEDDPKLFSALTALEDALEQSGRTTKKRLQALMAGRHRDAA